ncbi:hypothetical protein CRE_06612 [Caenorhabditis remanei]|uniref:Uncharacterized protein n=1 Tax=Caenorhabditis remanei TaxID=31234 RepID=E3M1S5_CAERE|nr:hypothetical protein CRE_06612 [Caenorhabditis remanei]
MIDIDFTEPEWLLTYYDCIGLLSSILNLLGIYLLIFKSGRLGTFRFHFLTFQILSVLTDIHLTILMKPIPLTPLFAGYTVGIMPKYFNISAHHCAMLTGFVAVVQLESLVLCFAKMHQAIAVVLNTHVVPRFLEYFCYSLCILCPIGLSGCIEYFHISQDEQWMYLLQVYPELVPGFQTLTHFVLYIKTRHLNQLLVTMILSGMSLFLIFVLFLFDIFNLMVDLKIRRSTSYYQKHKEAMHSLMVQFVTSSICLVPPFMLVIVVFFKVPHGQFLSEIFIAWFVSHSSINMISLIVFFPPYQNFFLRFLKRKNSKHTTPVAVVPAAMSSGM